MTTVHEIDGDIYFIGDFAPKGVLKTVGIPDDKLPKDGQSAVCIPRKFIEAYFMEYAAKILAGK